MTHKIGGGLGGPVEDFFQGAKESTIGAVGKAYRHNGPVKSLLFGGATVVAGRRLTIHTKSGQSLQVEWRPPRKLGLDALD